MKRRNVSNMELTLFTTGGGLKMKKPFKHDKRKKVDIKRYIKSTSSPHAPLSPPPSTPRPTTTKTNYNNNPGYHYKYADRFQESCSVISILIYCLQKAQSC